jgi:membrane fusion protein, copper/silver efflux system
MRRVACAILVPALAVLCFVAGRHSVHARAGTDGRRVLYYVDPMHPAYKSDRPGIAPDCGMKLEPVYADGGEPATGVAELPAGAVRINAEQQQLIGVRVDQVERTSGPRTVRLLGRVAADETRVYRVNAGVDGFVRETCDDAVGTEVKKGQKLADFYAPDVLTLAAGFISAEEHPQGVVTETELRGIRSWVDRLRNLGMSDAQIRSIAETRQVPEDVHIVSPAHGYIVSRDISPGLRFEAHTEFYRIADLSRVWIMADLHENEAQQFRPGAVATIVLPQGGKLRARVSRVLPQIDPATRTYKLRLEANNPGVVLRPDMFVDVELDVRAPTGLSVPEDALLDSGLAKRVFVETGEGVFVPREVETGSRFSGRVQIVSGLAEGDRVVTSGTFLVDSESRLKDGAAGAGSAN